MSQPESVKEAKWRGRAFRAWAIVGTCAIIAVVIFICQIVWQAVAVAIVTALSVFLLHGIVDRLVELHLPRWAAVAITFLAVTIIILGCVVALIPALISQLTSFVNQLPTYTSQLQEMVRNIGNYVTFIDSNTAINLLQEFMTFVKEQAGSVASGLANGVIGGLVSVGNLFLVAFISFICSFWILLDLSTIDREIRMLVGEKRQKDLDIIADAFGTAVYGWAKSTLLCAVITGAASWLAFMILGIPYSAVLGFICGVLYFIPYIGSMLSCAIVALIALLASPLACILSIVFNMLLNNIVGNIISPRLMKSSVNVYPALILIAILIGSALGGIAGMLLSIPIIGAMQGVFVTYYEARTGKSLLTEDGVLFHKEKEKKLPSLNFEGEKKKDRGDDESGSSDS